MIVMNISGGLGNQLFMYCFARSLSKDLNEELYLDISNFNANSSRHEIYGLHPFNIKGIVGNYPIVKNLNNFVYFIDFPSNFKESTLMITHPNICTISNFFMTKIKNYLIRYLTKKQGFYFKEPNLTEITTDYTKTINDFKNIKTPSYFQGNYQVNCDSKNRLFISEIYFNKYNKLIHDDLNYMIPLTEESQNLANEMKQCDSICLHLRHGDYTQLPDFGLCSKEYYEKSIDTISSELDNPKFFIFSDNIEHAKKIINIAHPNKFIDFKENNELIARGNGELLKLMSCCKHFIIANSTLSWWAAFLSENKDKIIITPEPWFQNRRIMGVETIDNKKPIKIINNNSELFYNSKKLIYRLNSKNSSFKNINYENNDQSYKIKDITNNSKIILKETNNNTYNQLIIKISLESNCFNCLRILFKTKDKKYSKKIFKLFYYENDDFSHYFILPENAILDDLIIKPAYPFKSKEDYVIIKSFEIKEINKNW